MEEDTLQIKTKHRIYTFISHLSLHTWEQKYYLQKLHWLGCQRSSQEPTKQLTRIYEGTIYHIVTGDTSIRLTKPSERRIAKKDKHPGYIGIGTIQQGKNRLQIYEHPRNTGIGTIQQGGDRLQILVTDNETNSPHADPNHGQQNEGEHQTNITHVKPQQNNNHQEDNMQIECIMGEQEIPFESHNGFVNQTPLAFENQHESNNHTPITNEPNKQQHKNATSDTHKHHVPTRKPEDWHKQSKLERILEKYDSYQNVRQGDTEKMIDFIRRFQNAHLDLENEGTPIPPHLLTLDLLRKSNLSERDIRIAIASCDTEKTGGPYLRALDLLREANLEEDLEEEDASTTTATNSTEENGQEFYEGIRSYLRFMDALRNHTPRKSQ